MIEYENLIIPKCKKFNGYKPCVSYKNCLEEGCQLENDENKIGTKILIISLDALGTVLMNTALLYSIKRKFPISTIYWITQPSAEKILLNNPLIDFLFTWTDENRMILRQIKFDFVFNTDKSNYACAFANEVYGEVKRGFLLNEDGKIIPASKHAMYSYNLGLDDKLKFRINQKTGLEIISEALELDYQKDEYIFNFTDDEIKFIEEYKKEIHYNPSIKYVGFNTGCSNLFPNKKMTIEQHVFLINEISKLDNTKIVLLGGKEDTERNQKIYSLLADEIKQKVINTPTELGIRKGACFMSIADIVITGDSFGMHLAIALKKFVIAWFGLSCWTEIEIYNRGIKLYQENLECSPCWKKVCPNNLECISGIDLNKIINEVKNFNK
ncbi:glycosyltransferase family 9 protein [Stygiobacter electus]|uniref:Glycosyltransferase family 9 protein n=1 Tax=Stygiobacter electus TaxID=3032292 RepID=A0AAE3NXJ5_9BACT|nr:glycosyltransferase family 9 protein [Stygiobacter electus]MDF1610619.1 glycosyltransferase family 9 protein [Stygiobacter electus]